MLKTVGLFTALALWALLSPVLGQATDSIPLLRVPRQASPPSLFSSNVTVSDVNGFAYLARMEIGAQNLLVLLDTGSSDLWVVSSNCTEDDCEGVPKYQPTPSLDLSPTDFELRYLLGEVSGVVGTETVGLGPYEIVSQAFALANATAGLGMTATGNSGILGLSFPVEASIPDTSGRTLLENLMSPLAEADRYFAIKLGRDQNSSSFTIGAVDRTYAASSAALAYTPVYPAAKSVYDYWKLPLQAITVNGTAFGLSRSRVRGAPSPIAVLDTGTTLVLGPTADVERLWQSVGGARKTDGGWQVRCDRAMVLGMVLGQGPGAQAYYVDPADLAWREGGRDGDWCMGGVQANDDVSSGDWLLGDTFLRNVYAVHHVGNSTQPPMIGLLGLTDPQSALQNFRVERGDDPTPPVPVLATAKPYSAGVSGGAICGIAAAGGFVFGVVLTVAITAWVARKAARY